jgi:sugar/nucleoside kinase (ribokinase family)
VIALVGNLSRDLLPGEPPRPGGGVFHGARALRQLGVRGRLYARCAPADRGELLRPLVRLGLPVELVPARETTAFEIRYDGEERHFQVLAVGEAWQPVDLPPAVTWVHVAPLLRGDFPAATLAALARRRRLAFDAHGLVRRRATGPLELDDDFDPELLHHVWVLKLSDEEADVLGDPSALPVREVLLTHGSRGLTVHTAGTAERIPAMSVDADPTGAGDAFCAAYVAGRAAGLGPVPSARRAVSVVAAVLAEQ